MSGVDLVQWLRDQLDEDERIARAATSGPWTWTPENDVWDQNGPTLIREGTDAPDAKLVEVAAGWGHDAWGMHISEADKAHIAAHDPARVLREIDAKREIVEQHVPVGDGTVCLSYCHTRTPGEHQPWPCLTLRLLALPHADRPGYGDEWKPRQLYRAGMPGVIDYREEGT